VDDLSFRASPGEIVGLVGPSGSGKSTVIGCLAGLVVATSGSIRVTSFGLLPQRHELYDDVRAEGMLAWAAGLAGMRGAAVVERVADVLASIGLADQARVPARRLSYSAQRLLAFGCAIVHRPPLLLLDEPSANLDRESRTVLAMHIRAQAESGACVLVATQDEADAAASCHRILTLSLKV
jgi:ABC-2 type transport system ATP-binding protein